MCNNCKCNCNCNNNDITINSDVAGRDGLSSYQIAINTGKFSGTESQFVDWIKGPKGDIGNTYIPIETNVYFD